MDETALIEVDKSLVDTDLDEPVVDTEKPNRFLQGGRKYIFMTDRLKCHYISRVMETGLLQKSALYVGVSIENAKLQRNVDEEFAEAVKMALEVYRDNISGEIHRRGIEGVLQPVFYMGEQCGTIRRYSDKLLEMHAKRHIHEYRDHQITDVNVTGGVMVIPAGPQSVEDWEDQNNAPLEVIDVTEVEEVPAERETERS